MAQASALKRASSHSLPARGRRRSLAEVDPGRRTASVAIYRRTSAGDALFPDATSGKQDNSLSFAGHKQHPILEHGALRKVLEDNAIRLMTSSGDEIRTRVRRAEKAHSKAEAASVFHMPKPLGIIIGRWWFQLGLLAWCVLWALQVAALDQSRDQVSRRFMHFRFVPTQLRDNSPVNGKLGITDFYLLFDGCRIAEADDVWEENGMLFKSFVKETTVNGWSIITPEEEPGGDAVAFRIEGSNDMHAWDLVGTPVWVTHHQRRVTYRTESLIYTTARASEITFDPRGEQQRLQNIAQGVFLIAVALVAMVLTWLDRAREASWMLVGCLPVVSALNFRTAVLLLAEGRSLQAFRPMASTVLPLALAAGLTVGFVGRRLAELMALGVVPMLIVVIDNTVIWRQSSVRDIVEEIPYFAFAMVLLFLALTVLQRRRLRVSRRAMEGARAEYEAAWTSVLEELGTCAEERAAFLKLASTLDRLSTHTSTRRPRHAVRIRSAAEWAATEAASSADGAPDSHLRCPHSATAIPSLLRRPTMTNLGRHIARQGSRRILRLASTSGNSTRRASVGEFDSHDVQIVRDMDQVYMMARVIQPFLRAKVFQWAVSSGGCLKVTPTLAGKTRGGVDLLVPPQGNGAPSPAAKPALKKLGSSLLRGLGSSVRRALTITPDFRAQPTRASSASSASASRTQPGSPARSSAGGSSPGKPGPDVTVGGLHSDQSQGQTKGPKVRWDAESESKSRRSRLIHWKSLSSESLWAAMGVSSRGSGTNVWDGSASELSDAEWKLVGPGDYKRVAWAPLKGLKRFVNKTRKVYGGNVSKVIDVCRERVVFDSLAALHACIDAIAKDASNVQIRRVKNGLTTKYGDFEGFRVVVLDLWLIGPQVAALGLEHHVVELQLLLRPFALIQERSPHKQYIEYRNARTAAQLRTFEKLRAWWARRVRSGHRARSHSQAAMDLLATSHRRSSSGHPASLLPRPSASASIGRQIPSTESQASAPLISPSPSSGAGVHWQGSPSRRLSQGRAASNHHECSMLLRLPPKTGDEVRRLSSGAEGDIGRTEAMDVLRGDGATQNARGFKLQPADEAEEAAAEAVHARQDAGECAIEVLPVQPAMTMLGDAPRGGVALPGQVQEEEEMETTRVACGAVYWTAGTVLPVEGSGSELGVWGRDHGGEVPAGPGPEVEGAAAAAAAAATRQQARHGEVQPGPVVTVQGGSEPESEQHPDPASGRGERRSSAYSAAGAGAQTAGASGARRTAAPASGGGSEDGEQPQAMGHAPAADSSNTASRRRSSLGILIGSRLRSSLVIGSRRRSSLGIRSCASVQSAQSAEDGDQPAGRAPAVDGWNLASRRRSSLGIGSRLQSSLGIGRRLAAVGQRVSSMGEQLLHPPSGGIMMTASLKDVMNVTGKGGAQLCSLRRACQEVAWLTPVEAALKSLVRQAMQSEGGPLMRRLEGTAREAFAGSRIESVSFSSSPLPSMTSYKRVQIALGVIGMLFWCSALSLHPHNTADLLSLRFRTAAIPQHRTLNATRPAALMGGTLKNGCPAHAFMPAGMSEEEWVLDDTHHRGVGTGGANGWYFVLEGGGSVEEMEVGVQGLRVMEDGEEEWVCLLGEKRGRGSEDCTQPSSQAQTTHSTLRKALVHGDPDVTILSADLRAPLAHLLGFVLVPTLRGIAYTLIGMVGCFYKSATHRSDGILGSLHLAVAALLIAAGALEHGTPGSAYQWWYVQAAAMLALVVGVMLRWRGLVALQGAVCLVSVVCQVQLYPQRSWISQRGWGKFSGEGLWLGLVLAGDMVMMCATLSLTVLWRYTVQTSEHMIQKDKMTYDEVWTKLVKNEAEKQNLEELQATVSALKVTSNNNPRQQHFMDLDLQGLGIRDLTQPEGQLSEQLLEAPALLKPDHGMSLGEPRSFVRSLDQLYAQAHVVDILLRDKIQLWAKASNGYLRVVKDKHSREGSRWIKWAECEERKELKRDIVWGGVKKVDRSIQKILRSYNGDVSRLTDISRGCIAFASVKDINDCVLAIAADAAAEQLKVVRVKNRLNPQHDSVTTAGYRDVALNIRLGGDDAMRYKVASHIAEIQLILLPFAQVKTNEGHKRYVQFRNLRAE